MNLGLSVFLTDSNLIYEAVLSVSLLSAQKSTELNYFRPQKC